MVLVSVSIHEGRISRTFFGSLKASRRWKLKKLIILENITSNELFGDFDFFILHTCPWYLQKVALKISQNLELRILKSENLKVIQNVEFKILES